MKLLKYMTIFALFAQAASAQSISDQELQDRFNKAFSVFNQQTASDEDVAKLADPKKENTRTEAPVEFSGEKNIVKSSNAVQQVSEPQAAVTEELEMPKTIGKKINSAKNFLVLQDRPILIDMQNATLKQIVQEALNQVAYDDTWTIKWRLKDENKYIINERMNLTAEVDFDSFIGSMIETITNITGITLSTKVFHKNKIIIITDSY